MKVDASPAHALFRDSQCQIATPVDLSAVDKSLDAGPSAQITRIQVRDFYRRKRIAGV
jgi:hypothetical protein